MLGRGYVQEWWYEDCGPEFDRCMETQDFLLADLVMLS